MEKRFLVAAGGTGGHLFPAMAVVEEILRRTGGNAKFHFIGTQNRIESKKVPEAGYNYNPMPIKPFPGMKLKAIGWYFEFRKSIKIAKKIIEENNIDAVICTGAYLSVPPGYAAAKLGKPVFLMESNVNLGKAHKMLLDKAENIFISWKDTANLLGDNKHKAILSGNPVRKSIFNKIKSDDAKEKLGFPKNKPLLFVFGGSLGAESINSFISQNIVDIHNLGVSLLWQTGGSFNTTEYGGEDLPPDIRKVRFIDDMGLAYSAADLIISRSGATAVSEICACGLPAVLVPYPSAKNKEQLLNARHLSDSKAAILMADNLLDSKLMEVLTELVNNENMRKLLAKNSKSFGTPNAASNIARVILDKV